MKTNHDNQAWKFIGLMAAGVVAITLIVLVFFIVNEGKSGVNGSVSQLNAVTNKYTDINREKYDGLEVKGSVLLDIIKQETDLSEITVEYLTLASTTLTTASASTLLLERGATNYINPYGTFKGTVVKDASGVLTKLEFKQIKK